MTPDRTGKDPYLLCRKFPALGNFVQETPHLFWSERFSKALVIGDAFSHMLKQGKRVTLADANQEMALLNRVLDRKSLRQPAMHEVPRVLTAGAPVFIDGKVTQAELGLVRTAAGFANTAKSALFSRAVGFDHREIAV